MAEKLNLLQKLAKIQDIADVVRKDKKGYNYTYSDINEILAKVTGGMKRHHVSLLQKIDGANAHVSQQTIVNTKWDKTVEQFFDQTSTEMLVYTDMCFVWVDNDNPTDQIEVPWFVVGMQADPSQAFGSGLTYCKRYFLTNYFHIAQDNDVDGYRSRQKEAEDAERKAITDELIRQFDSQLRQFLADHPDKNEEIQKFITGFAKDKKYFNIKDPELAAKMLRDFKTKFVEGEK